jgi:hypothetical protein
MLRMLVNTRKVVEKRLSILVGTEYVSYKQLAYAHLFCWLGARCLREAVGGMLKFPPQPMKLLRNLGGIVFCFGRVFLEDSEFRLQFRNEILACLKELWVRLAVVSGRTPRNSATNAR